MKAGRLLLSASTLAAMLAADAFAQQAQPQRQPPRRARPAIATPAPPKPAPAPVVPQEKPLVELSEIVGALALLSQVCAPATRVNPWRTRMEDLVEAEGENSGLREKMMGAYNRGFSEYAVSYRQCTEAARAARTLLTRDASRLARDLERRFGS